tara:strand:- start:543 stop:695 length:153 start_codon:yes stop_codon:yes gene_type:complete
MFTALDAAQLMDALTTAGTADKLTPVSICQVSPFAGSQADYVVIFTTIKV